MTIRPQSLATLLLLVPLCALGCKDKDTSAAVASSASASPSAASSGAAAASASGAADAVVDGVVPPPKEGEDPKLQVGAWTKYAVSGPTGKGESTYSIVDKREGNDWVIEVDRTGTMPIIVQAVVNVPGVRDFKNIKLKSAKFRMNNGPVQEIPSVKGSPYEAVFQQLLGAFEMPEYKDMEQEDVTVKAGTFRSSYRWKHKMSFLGIMAEETIWTHPHLSLPAMVKMTATNGVSYELVSYGLTGASAQL